MIESVSPYAVIMAVLMFVLIVGFLWICRDAVRSGMTFEGEIKNRLLSMKIRTNPSHPSHLPAADDTDDPVSPARREEEAT
jgi:hypothetical protein